jgi:hypothetical protein
VHDRWRGIYVVVLVSIVALTITCCVGVATATANDLLPLPRIVDRQATPLTPDRLAPFAQKVQDGFNSLYEFIEHSRDGSGDGTAPTTPSPPAITAAGLNWCRWWSFQDMAKEVTNYPWLNVEATLISDLSRCLTQQFPGNLRVALAANSAAQDNEQKLAQLVAAGNPGANPAAIPLAIQTWATWFSLSAQAVPPQS